MALVKHAQRLDRKTELTEQRQRVVRGSGLNDNEHDKKRMT